MSGQNRSQYTPSDANSGNESLNDALDRSSHELQLLANFYHQHGYTERAQEIYKTILKLRKEQDERNRRSQKS